MGKGARARKERVEERATLTEAQKKAQHGKRLRHTVAWVAGLLVVVLLAFGILYSNGTLQRNMTAMTVGDTKVTGMEYSYYYNQLRNSFVSQNSDSLAQAGINVSTLDDAAYTQDLTFGEYFRQQAESSLKDIYALYDEAMAQNYTISEEGQKSYESSIEALQTEAKSQGMSPNKYLKEGLGLSVSFNDYKDILQRSSLAQDFYNKTQAKSSHTDEELTAYYKENADQFDKADYRVFQVFFEKGETDEETNKNKEAAKATAEEFLAKVTDEQSFIDLAREYATEDQKEKYAEDDGTLEKGVALTSSGTVSDWVKDPARKSGDKDVLEISTNYSVMYFVDRYLEEEATVDVRHILLKSDDTNDGEIKQKAEDLLQQWKDGEHTEDSFAQLATENTEDTGSSTTGGLYEGVRPGQMVAAFNDWCFDPSRKGGDTGIVKTDYGYHIMYFVGAGDLAWKADAENALSNQEYSDYLDSLLEKYKITKNEKVINMVI